MSKKTVNPKYARPVRQTDQALSQTADWTRHLPWVLAAVLFLMLALIYFPVAFGGKTPIASDITQWQGAAKSIIDYNKEHSDQALWTQSMFSGMPAYMISFPNRFPFLESLINLLGKIMNWRILLLFIGGLGIFLLLRFWKLDPWICFAGAVAFVFSCHWVGLLEIGHNTKFRAIMYVPWVIWALMYLRKRPGLLGLGFLASTLIVQLRENHPQISYYLYLFVGMYWLWQLIESFINKDHKQFWLFTALTAAAFGLTALAVMNPYLSTMEYSHYTMRGGASGLETAYAQGWSFHPLEIFGLIVPDAFGGINQNYWGFMPFTQIYNYFGIVVLAFGLLALSTQKHRRLAIFLWISSVLFTLMSFGSFAPALSDLLLKYLPYFNKFRVPSMILTMVQINAVLLAGLGLDTLKDRADAQDKSYSRMLLKVFWICGGVFILWIALSKTLFGGLSFTSAGELDQLKARGMEKLPADMLSTRLDLLYKSGILSFLLLSVSMGLAYLRSIGKLRNTGFMILIILAVFVDLWVYTGKHMRDLKPAQQYFDRFEPMDYDQFMLQDKRQHRVYPISQSLFTQSSLPKPAGEWAYHHQIITGYSAAKLKRYDDLLKLLDGDAKKQRPGEWQRYLMGLFAVDEGKDPREIPMPVLSMLNAKYFVHPEAIPMDSLLTRIRPVFTSESGITIYENRDVLPRAWFVDEVRQVSPADSILELMSSESFDPRRIAYVESPVQSVSKPQSSQVKQTKAEMHELEYELSTDKDAFLVLSEVYYPAGWKATLDGKDIPIQAANYALRGLRIPAGQHQLRLVFAPDSYKRGVTFSLIGLLVSILALGAGLALHYRKSRPADQA